MKIREILKQPESKTLEFKKEVPKNRQNLLKTVIASANSAGGHIYKEIGANLNIHHNTALKRLRQLEEKGLVHKQGSGPRVRYSV